MIKQLIICLSLATIPVANIITPTLSQPIKIVSGGSLQMKIRLLTNKQHPKITTADLAVVQKTLGNRITALGLARPTFKSDGDNRLIVTIDNIKNAIGAENIRDILAVGGKLELRAQKIGADEKLQPALERLRELRKTQILLKSLDKKQIAANKNAIAKQQIEISNLFDRPIITNRQVAKVAAQQVMRDGSTEFIDIFSGKNKPQPTGMWEVALEFDRTGGDAFAKMTQNLAGTGRLIGIFLDGEAISTPTVGVNFVETGITGGKAVIHGNFTAESASYIANQIRSGALPVPIEIVEIQPLRAK